MITVLSVENALSWSWGIVIRQLIAHLPAEQYRFCRILRGLFACQNPRCGKGIVHPVDDDLQRHFDLILPQNHDGVRYIRDETRSKTAVRIGGLDMSNHLDPTRYYGDFRAVGAIIATNDQLAGFARPVNEHVAVIPNGVPLDRFRPRENFHRRSSTDTFTLGFAGNVTGMGGEYKGYRHFVQACCNLTKYGVQPKYLLHAHNQIAHDQMPEGFYHQIDALVLPSRGEGCSNVVTEALACGVPVICTQRGFHGERLTDGQQCLYIQRELDPTIDSPQTTRQIEQAVCRLMSEPDLYERLARNGRAFAEQNHDVRQVAAMYDEVFRGLIARRQAAGER